MKRRKTMFPLNKFLTHNPGEDPWDFVPKLRLDDLEPRSDDCPIRVSYLLSFTNYRRSQLARTLECLARQDTKCFEVLICDDGSTQDMKSVFDLFHPYLRMKIFRLERYGF